MKNKRFDPIDTFNEIWSLFRSNYSGFEHRKIDWKQVYRLYRKKLNAETSEDELFDIVSNMLRILNDNHVQVKTQDPERNFWSGSIGFIMETINHDESNNIFTILPVSDDNFKEKLKSNHGFSYAWLNNKIGYFHFNAFESLQETEVMMSTLLDYFSSSDSLIIDIRRNKGGDDRVGKAIADYFADQKRDYMITRKGKSIEKSASREEKIWFIEPKKENRYLKPVILLTDRTTFSAAENFALAMRELPHVSLVGDFTSGSFADAEWHEVSCGWQVYIPNSVFTDKFGFCWEGIGIPPDYRIVAKPIAVKQGKDELFDFATGLLS